MRFILAFLFSFLLLGQTVTYALVGQKLANVLIPTGGTSCDRVLIDPAGF
jgi:hypothetical protein